jgi:hypothetical protein
MLVLAGELSELRGGAVANRDAAEARGTGPRCPKMNSPRGQRTLSIPVPSSSTLGSPDESLGRLEQSLRETVACNNVQLNESGQAVVAGMVAGRSCKDAGTQLGGQRSVISDPV